MVFYPRRAWGDLHFSRGGVDLLKAEWLALVIPVVAAAYRHKLDNEESLCGW